MDIVRKYAHLVKVGEVVSNCSHLELVIETADSLDGGIALTIFDLETGERNTWYFASFDVLA